MQKNNSFKLAIMIAISLCMFSNTSFAQMYDKKYAKLTKHYSRTIQIGPEFLDTIKKANKLEKKNIDEALIFLSKLDESNLKPDERGFLHHYRGYLLSDQHKYSESIAAYEKSIYKTSLYFSSNNKTLYSLASQSYLIKDYKRVIKYFNFWLVYNRSPSADIYFMLGEAYFHTNNYALALEYLNLAKKKRPIKKKKLNQIMQTMEKVKLKIDNNRNKLGNPSNSSSLIERSYWPALKIAPIYPRKAFQKNIQGYVILNYNISNKGYPTDIKVTESTNPIFNKNAINATNATKQSKYMLSEKTKDKIFVRNISSKVSFKLDL